MDTPCSQSQFESQSYKSKKPLRCIVKLGGAAITCKNNLEMINEENLALVSSQLRQVIMRSPSVRTMDWSKQAEAKELVVPDNFGEEQIKCDTFIVVHGAGSFGHFQASKSGVHKGGLPLPIVTAGFVATRISVTSLNLEVVRALAKDGIPAVGISPLASGWSTHKRNVENANIAEVVRIIDSGFIPVLHGDAVFDSFQGCTILSGDIIIRHLAQELKPQYVVFLTDVPGVFDRPPTEVNSVLLKEIVVKEDGSWSVVKPLLPHMDNAVQTTTVAHDTTGGMATKISEAAAIAKFGIDVYIVQAGTDHSLKALKENKDPELLDRGPNQEQHRRSHNKSNAKKGNKEPRACWIELNQGRQGDNRVHPTSQSLKGE